MHPILENHIYEMHAIKWIFSNNILMNVEEYVMQNVFSKCQVDHKHKIM